MASYVLLQIFLVAVACGNLHSFAQEVLFSDAHSVYFPKEDATVNRRVENIPSQPPPLDVRPKLKPPCAENIDPVNFHISPCIRDAQYNENVQRRISELLNQSPSINDIVQDPMLRVILNDTLTPTEEISPTTRFGGFRETPVCGAQEELIFPQRAKTPKNDWVFVVNQEDVKQALRVEKCTREGNACNIGVPTNDVETVCRQKYVYRRMLILGSNNIQPEEVLMPSCCVCYSRRQNFDIGTRIAIEGNNTGTVRSEDSVPNQPPPRTGQPLHFNSPRDATGPSALMRNTPTIFPLINVHNQQRRGVVQRLQPFYHRMSYK